MTYPRTVCSHEGYALVHHVTGEHRIEHEESGQCSTWLPYIDIEEVKANPASMEDYALDYSIEDNDPAIREMAGVIRATQGAVDFIAGGNSYVEEIAAEWVAAGFTTQSASAWWQAGAFSAERAAEMRDDGLTPEQVSHADCPKLEGYSWAYARCNGDCSRQDVIDACKGQ